MKTNITFETMNEEITPPIFNGPGRPRVYNFDTLEVGEIQHIACKKDSRDDKLKSARSMCSINSVDGKVFKATATATGVAIKREK